MDQRVIRELKVFYCTNVVRCHIKYIDTGETIPNINILEAMCIFIRSWDAVSSNTVKMCFRKACISEETQVASIEDEDDPFEMAAENVNDLKSHGLIDENLVVDDYVDIDFEVCPSETHAITD